MARRLIGLDIGTNAVTIAEVTPGFPPRLDMFAQVALPREAMREGEIADEAAVTDAVARLRNEVGLKKAIVRVGIASPRVVVRQVEMPVMTRDELSSALQFQAADLIPIPVEDAIIDFAILGDIGPSADGTHEPTMQVLLAAAYESTVLKLVSAVEAGGFQVGAVDLVPLALTRALARPAAVPATAPAASGGVALADEPVGAEGIVSLGGGVTSIAVHENGVPQFVRVIGSGGRELTDAIATDLNVPVETAEALKRALGHPQPDEMVNRARTAIDRPLSVLLDEVRSSIDYYRNQPGAARLSRVVVTGGSAQLPGMPERLSALLGVQVEPAYMHDLLSIGDIGFPPEELPRLEPYLPAPVGLALGGAGVGTVVDLTPKRRRARTTTRTKFDQRIVAGVVAGIVLLVAGTYYERQQVSSAKHNRDKAAGELSKLQSQLFYQQNAGSGHAKVSDATRKSAAASILAQDIQWAQVVDEIGNNDLPGGVLFTSVSGTRTQVAARASTAPTTSSGTSGSSGAAAGAASSAAASSNAASSASAGSTAATPTAAGAGALGGLGAAPIPSCKLVPASLGTFTFQGTAPSVPLIAQTIDNLNQDKNVQNAWLTSAQATTNGSSKTFTFTISAQLNVGARGNRLEEFKLCR
jgi:type IV pilus assembly protein PilM